MTQLPDRLSARRTLLGWQRVVVPAVVASVVVSLVTAPMASLTVLTAAGTGFYLFGLGWKARMISSALNERAVATRPPLLHDTDVPTYTVLVPLYEEGDVVDGLIDHLGRLDYPHHKLQVLLLCEHDDDETLTAIGRTVLPSFVELVVCPPGTPRTKPRACNVGLERATGELCVIYDAEDRPQLDQLRLAATEFARSPHDVVCVQARLDYHNARHNWLTRFFTVEYNHWFELLLPALSARELPLPLGGTSNHFRTEALHQLGGWDPYNVTEDADLGMRLYAAGYRTDVIDSVTWEEACSQLRPWIRQRTRWTKGYMQTFLVHVRSLSWATRRPRPVRALAAFVLLVGGTPAVNLINPLFWGLLLVHALTRSELIVRIIPGPVLYLGVVSLVAGNLLFVFVYIVGVGHSSRWYLGRSAVLSPTYWALMSLATWRALLQIIVEPHLWEKTPHGLTEYPASAGAPRTGGDDTPPGAAQVAPSETPARARGRVPVLATASPTPDQVQVFDLSEVEVPVEVPGWVRRAASVGARLVVVGVLALLGAGAAELATQPSLLPPNEPELAQPDRLDARLTGATVRSETADAPAQEPAAAPVPSPRSDDPSDGE